MADRSRSAAAARPAPPFAFPEVLQPVSESLANLGHTAYWVGPCVTGLVEDTRPESFALVTDATRQRLTALFPGAVPLGDARDTVMIPTPAGPVDATPQCPEIADELATIDFTIHAIAYDARNDELLDPFGGLRDLAAGLLRAVGSATDRLEADPLRGLRAVRLIATRRLKLDPALEAAIASTPPGLESTARIRIREELVAMMLAPGVGGAWSVFEQSGIARTLAPDTQPDAGALIEQLPCELTLRLSAWLIGARARRALQRLRFSRRIVDRVEHLLQHHPIDARLDPDRLPAIARFARRVSVADQTALIALRRAQLRTASPDSGGTLDRLERALIDQREHRSPRQQLALDGEQIMKELECGPGPNVGRAIAFLKGRVATNPACNEPAELRRLLRAWRTAANHN